MGVMPGTALVPSNLAPDSGISKQRTVAQSVEWNRGKLAVDWVDLLGLTRPRYD